jgi:hypothetical protein
MILFHITGKDAAASILVGGFVDGEGRYMTDKTFEGVWLSDRPLDEAKPFNAAVTLQVEFPPDVVLADYEWVEEGKDYREWLVPAEMINSLAKTTIFDDGLDYGA